MTCGRHLRQTLRSPACDCHHRLAAAHIGHGHIFPTDTHRQPRAKRLRAGLFRRPAFGIGAGHIFARLRLALLNLCKNPVFKPIPKAVQCALDPVNIRQICTDT